jgi:hypothetical protein
LLLLLLLLSFVWRDVAFLEQLLICGVASENDDKFILLSLLLTVVSVAIGEEKDEKSEFLGRVVVDDVLRCSPSRSGSSNDALFVGSRLLL